MRIVAGRFRSRTLIAPKTSATRPTTDRARESLFNVLTNHISFEGIRVLDLFAGSGALGFEALSRGAEHVIFVERDKQAIDTIKANAEALGVTLEIQIKKEDVFTFVTHHHDLYDLILSDAPYDSAPARLQLPTTLVHRIATGGVIAIEHRTGDEIVLPEGTRLIRELKAGEASFTIFQLS